MTKWVFDEILRVVLPKDLDEVDNQYYHESVQQYMDWVDAHELLYYYIQSPLMRFVNNYYSYENYPIKTFRKNMERAITYYWNTEEEHAVDMTRHLWKLLDGRQVYVEPTDGSDGYFVTTNYIWYTQPDGCDICIAKNGKYLRNLKKINTHYNCRCTVTKEQIITDANGTIIDKITEVL